MAEYGGCFYCGGKVTEKYLAREIWWEDRLHIIENVPMGACTHDGSVTLSWDPATTAESYNVYFAGSAGVSPSVNDGVFDATQTSYVHEGLTNGEDYFYVVTAVNGTGEGPASAEASATPQAAVATTDSPTGVMATAGDGRATVSWDPADGAASYVIYLYGRGIGGWQRELYRAFGRPADPRCG